MQRQQLTRSFQGLGSGFLFLALACAAGGGQTTFSSSTAPWALPSEFSTDEWLINTWEDQEGPPEYTATAMVQTSDGYLWFGTFGGLERFDGVKLTSFNTGNTPQLPSDGIVNLHLDARGWLWISTARTPSWCCDRN